MKLRSRILLCACLLVLPAFAELSAVADVLITTGAPSLSAKAPKLREPIHIVLDGAQKPSDCMTEGRIVQNEMQTLPFPPGWTVAIMCTPVRWQTILQQADSPPTQTAFTSFSQRLTILNGAIFRGFPATYRHTLAHELAHVQCQCKDEARAERLAKELEKKSSTKPKPRTEAKEAAGGL
jgi:hypothetical protein